MCIAKIKTIIQKIKDWFRKTWNWIKIKIKKILISLGIIGVAVASGISAIPQEVSYKNIPLLPSQQREMTQIINYQTSHTPLQADIVMKQSWLLEDEIISIKPTKWVATSGGISYYKQGEEFKPIDLTLIDKGDYWQATKSNYQPKIPKYADDWFEFRNVFKGNDHMVRMKPVAGHVLGQLGGEGTMANRVVLYPDAFGPGIDLEVSAYNMNLLEKIIIRTPRSEEMSFDFEFEPPQGEKLKTHNIKTNYRREASFTKSLSVMDKDIEMGSDDNPTIIYAMKVWDSGVGVDELGNPLGKQENISAFLYKEGGKKFLRKTVSARFLTDAVYPVYTDADTGYKSPTATGTYGWDWTNPTYAYTSDNNYATRTGNIGGQSWETFGFGVPAGATINGIEVTCEAKCSADNKLVYYKIYNESYTGGMVFKQINWNTAEQEYPLGGSADLWGTTWTVADFADGTFYVLIQNRTTDTFSLDRIQVKVYYTPVAVAHRIMLIE